MIESILEHKVWEGNDATVTSLTTAAGSTALTGVGFNSAATGDILLYLDNAGVFRQLVLQSITNDTTATSRRPAVSVAGAVTPFTIGPTLQTCPYVNIDNSKIREFIYQAGGDARETGILFDANGGSQFSEDEGFTMKSFYLRFPYQFTMEGSSPIKIGFYYVDAAGTLIGRVQTIGEDSEIFITRENNEISLNAYVPPPIIPFPGYGGGKWSISMDVENAKLFASADIDNASYQLAAVSMLNAPDAISGQMCPVIGGVRVVHASEVLS